MSDDCCNDKGEITSSDIVLTPTEPCVDAVPSYPCQQPTIVCPQPGYPACGHTRPISGCCAPTTPAQPTPYYLTTAECVQNHAIQCAGDSLAAVQIANAINMPACGQAAIVSAPATATVLIGSYFWNPLYGYLQVINWDSIQHQATLQNNCNSGNAPVGTQIPSCTLFVVAPSPLSASGGSGDNGPRLAADFTAPQVSSCISITVTTAAGIQEGKAVSIAGGTYRVGAVLDDSTIQICNDGAGVTPNTPVIAKNGAGDFQYPVVLIDDNPCGHTPIFSGKIIVCKDGIISPLAGLLDLQIPVLDITTGEISFRTLGVPLLDCSALTTQLTLDPSYPSGTPYLVIVQDTSNFSGGQVVVIGGDLFTVVTVDNATQMHITPAVDPVAVITYPVGAPLCQASCCEQLGELQNWVYLNQRLNGHKAQQFQSDVTQSVDVVAGLMTAGQTVTGTESNIAVVNDTAKSLMVRVTYEASLQFVLHDTAAQYALMTASVMGSASNGGATPAAVLKSVQTTCIIPAAAAGGVATYQLEVSFEDVVTIPPGETWAIKVNSRITYTSGNAANVTVAHMFGRVVTTESTLF